MYKALRAGLATVLAAMVFVGNAVAGDEENKSGEQAETPTTKGMGVSGETTRGTATEGFTTDDEDSTTPEDAVEQGRTGARQ